jgi:hypothetical protein
VALEVPSALLDVENRYVISPQRALKAGLKILKINPIVFDKRLKN